MAMQVDEILHHEKSQYQDILVFKRCVCVRESFPITYTMALDEVVQCTEPPASLTPSCFLLPLSCFPLSLSLCLSPCTPVSKVYNRVLALDEVVQFTEEDEWAYHEMAANVPLFSHPNPRSVSGVPQSHWSCYCCVVAQLFPLLSLPPLSSFSSGPLSSPCLLLLHLILYLVPLLHFPSCLHLFPPTSSSPPPLLILQGAGGRRGRWRCAERGCETQDSGRDTHL